MLSVHVTYTLYLKPHSMLTTTLRGRHYCYANFTGFGGVRQETYSDKEIFPQEVHRGMLLGKISVSR